MDSSGTTEHLELVLNVTHAADRLPAVLIKWLLEKRTADRNNVGTSE